MTEISENIAQYRESCLLLRTRIDELSAQISAAQLDGELYKALQERRYHLYIELADMERSIRELEEYLPRVSGRSATTALAAQPRKAASA